VGRVSIDGVQATFDDPSLVADAGLIVWLLRSDAECSPVRARLP
jgi:hypothetical protein